MGSEAEVGLILRYELEIFYFEKCSHRLENVKHDSGNVPKYSRKTLSSGNVNCSTQNTNTEFHNIILFFVEIFSCP